VGDLINREALIGAGLVKRTQTLVFDGRYDLLPAVVGVGRLLQDIPVVGPYQRGRSPVVAEDRLVVLLCPRQRRL